MSLEKYIKFGKCYTLPMKIESVDKKNYFIERIGLTHFEKNDAIEYVRSKKECSPQLSDSIKELIQSCDNESEVYISKNGNIFFLPSDKKIEEIREQNDFYEVILLV